MTDEELAMAYADGELDAVSARRLEIRMAGEPAIAAAVAAHRALKARLEAAFAPIAEEPVPERFAGLLNSNVVQFQPRRRFAAIWRNAGALAACLVAGIAIGQFWHRDLVRSHGGQLIASGSLARSLDTQLVGESRDTRIIVSFRDNVGSYCRVFEARAMDGIACRVSEDWVLRRTHSAPEVASSIYRQASSPEKELMAAAQEMMAGEPLDKAAETEARAAKWHKAKR